VRRYFAVVAAVANLLLVDAVTKELAAGYLKGSPAVSVIDGFFNLAYVENRGCAWGLFQGRVWPLAVFGIVALGLLLWKRKSVFGDGLCGAAAEPLLYAGIVGNLIDRIVRGYVIDFLDFHWAEAYHFPCFNVADICISCAAGLLILAALSAKRTERGAVRQPPTTSH